MRCFIVGNGPSLNETNLDLLVGERTFGVNQCQLIYPKTKWRPTYWVCSDRDLKIPIEEWAAYLERALMYAHELAYRECATRRIAIANAGVGGKLDAYPRIKLEDIERSK